MPPYNPDRATATPNRRGSRLARWGLMAALGTAFGSLSGACDGLDVSDAGAKLDVDVKAQVERILSALFPDLTEDEISEIAADFSLDGVIASTCTARVALPNLAVGASIDLELAHDMEQYSQSLTPIRF